MDQTTRSLPSFFLLCFGLPLLLAATAIAALAAMPLIGGDAAGLSRAGSAWVAGLALAVAAWPLAAASFLGRRVAGPLRALGTFAANAAQHGGAAAPQGRFAMEAGPLAEGVRSLAAEHQRLSDLFHGLISGMPVPYLLVDTKERALNLNAELLDMVQIAGRVEDHLGRTLADIFYNDPTRTTVVGKAMANGQVFRNQQVEITGHKGLKRTVHYNVYPIYGKDGACLGGFCLYLDMTALVEKERQIQGHVAQVQAAAQSAGTISEQVMAASGRLTGLMQESSRRAGAQTGRSGQAATAMGQMAATVLEVARNASQAAHGADQAQAKAKDGAQVVRDAIAAIFQVKEHSESMRASLGDLGGKAEAIGQVMNVISDIADQTNLLALNAAIEAARAGDAGRGFAVVADEVRKLAEKTVQATSQVGAVVAGIQTGTTASIAAMDTAAGAIERSTELADRAGAALGEIVALVESTAAQVSNIATAAEEQSAASEEINRSIEEINELSEHTADAMAESEKAIGDVLRLFEELTSLIGNMRAS